MCTSTIDCVCGTIKFDPYSKYQKGSISEFSWKGDIIASIFLKFKNNHYRAELIKTGKNTHYDFHRIVPFVNFHRFTRLIRTKNAKFDNFLKKIHTFGYRQNTAGILRPII